ncbi:MAG: tRNA (adenosine(37)-N6)-threonylcarbamoyltransferase complex ATPase subunit type 1 TsaE [candidate division KSB1 bacterium]|nr:tRNA (adenosine(37)-N6)-threonylcarbamoyltransferase complex ATPase subunit type 1 TsaE [candidate division KSB1 bacterium]MDZ7336078.1 tRNA (adenosine(37)-N6)-threonylcarbamoyltransferase complex ATPase subunit type 1 TsaE [candidate division KSB1 bacterium]MDZ7358893.1 tRNA (adenosine(37)-N6)-threonylcarbamoyltransferase complex ATPase subunit type 1 TsaE [candidate division KSB1 bacterium]MDZ7399602.1 tRNA (adenosine(37)-N6)-threonylcarbamoyltransferase complex ATPase subunit type 1 TsaE [
MIVTFLSKHEHETIEWGKNLGRLLAPGDVIGLFGDLGSGKTKTIQGICLGLECHDPVTSPTFTIINEYQGKYPIYHFDLYRIDSEQELYDLGYEEYFYDEGICLIEWAERIQPLLPSDHLEIHLKSFFQPGMDNVREIVLKILGSKILGRDWQVIQRR